MTKKIFQLLLILFIFTNNPLIARDGAIGHAPIGIMGDHLHKKNEFMFSFRFMQMQIKDNLINGLFLDQSRLQILKIMVEDY